MKPSVMYMGHSACPFDTCSLQTVILILMFSVCIHGNVLEKRRRRKNCGTSESEDDSWNESSCRKRKAPKSRGDFTVLRIGLRKLRRIYVHH